MTDGPKVDEDFYDDLGAHMDRVHDKRSMKWPDHPGKVYLAYEQKGVYDTTVIIKFKWRY